MSCRAAFSAKSGWVGAFPNARAVRNYSHRLGNLALVSPAENQKLATLDWESKRKILAQSQLRIGTAAGRRAHWSPARILERTEEMIGVLFNEWEIKL